MTKIEKEISIPLGKNKKSLVIVLGVFIAMAAIFFLVVNLMKGEVYELSLQTVRDSPEVVAVFGEPIAPGLFVSGSVESTNGSGEATMQYSISGPDADGNVHFYAIKQGGQWYIQELWVILDGNYGAIPVVQ